MADGVIFSSTGQSPPANTSIWTDELAIGGSTAHAQIVKLANPTLDSTVMLGMTSGGLNVAIVNTALAIAALSTTSKIVVESTGTFPVTDNGGSLTIDGNATVSLLVGAAALSSANPMPVQLVSTSATPGPVMISSAAPASSDLGLAVRQVGFVAYSTNVTIAALSTASKVLAELSGGQSSVTVTSMPALSTASIIRIDTIASLPQSSVSISTTGAGGSTGNPLFVTALPVTIGAGSTFSSTKLTSTAAWTAFSSAASTRFVITDIDFFNKGATLSVLTMYDGTTGGTVVYRAALSSAGGGVARSLVTPIWGSTGNPITIECIPASTLYLNVRGYRSS